MYAPTNHTNPFTGAKLGFVGLVVFCFNRLLLQHTTIDFDMASLLTAVTYAILTTVAGHVTTFVVKRLGKKPFFKRVLKFLKLDKE